MPISSLGLVVEGQRDEFAIPELIKKCLPQAFIKPLSTNGPMKNKLVRRLKMLEYDSHAYDKVLVIKDSNSSDPESVKKQLINEVGHNTFRFPIEYIVIKRELETWLLADESALTRVSTDRGGRPISRVNGDLEEIQDAKEHLIRILGQAGITSYLPEVARQIAALALTENIRYRCPRYQYFEQALIDC